MAARPGVVKPTQLAGAASKSYNVASVWEQSAALDEDQLRVIEQLGQCCSQRPYPAHVVADDQQYAGADNGASQPKDTSYVGTLEEAVLRNANQFHKWHSELEAACASEQEEKYKRYADLLNNHMKSCEDILSKVDKTLEYFDTLLAQHRDVSHKSKVLYSSCEQLVKEKDQLVEFADAIRAKLKFFDEFEQVYAQFQQAQLSLDNEQFLVLLKRLDDCMEYVSTNPQYADAGVYATKFKQLQGRALGMVRNKVQQVLKHATQQVQAAIQESNRGQPLAAAAAAAPASGAAAQGQQQAPALAEGAEVSLLYVRFRAAAEPNLKGLLRDIESRSQRAEYKRLLEECQSLYSQARLQLVTPFVSQRIMSHQSLGNLPAFTRNGCEHLLRVCQLEGQLFEQFFPSARSAPECLTPLMDPLCMSLYDALRPVVVHMQDMDELCEMVDILKHEVLGDTLARRGSAGEALKPMLARALADVQGRLIYRAQAFIKEEVAGYQHTPHDVDYPKRLEQQPAAAATSQQQPGEAAAEPSNGEGNGVAAGANGAAQNGSQAADPYSELYPPVRSTLVCLSKLYRAVDGRTFGGLAQEAVSACTLSVQAASRAVAKKSGPLDAQLFMIKHLLFLREQIAPFDVEFAVTDIDLDFSHMRDHMRRVMSGEMGSLFALNASNAVVRMLGTGGPRVLTYQVDSKKELEKQLKGVCEAFIMALTKVAVEPMLSFITKVTAVKVSASAGGAPKPLREQAFASAAKVAEMVARVNEALAGPLPSAVAKMRAYLGNPSTHAILFKPVKSNIAEAHGQIALLLDQEFPPEETATIPLKQPHELAALLDAMC